MDARSPFCQQIASVLIGVLLLNPIVSAAAVIFALAAIFGIELHSCVGGGR